LRLLDQITGDRLDVAAAVDPTSYSVSSADDARFEQAIRPQRVYRKSRPIDQVRLAGWKHDCVMQHHLLLELGLPLREGSRYTITMEALGLPAQSLAMEYRRLRSEALHVGQIGFRPGDPAKVAFLSMWLGDGGGADLSDLGSFEVIDESGAVAFGAEPRLSKAAGDKTEDAYNNNFTKADVYELDFSALDKPGTYRVAVPGLGCSFPFEVSEDVWRRVFRVSARGFYHQRSGIELGPPFTDFRRPRTFHPDDGFVIYHSGTPLMRSGNGGFEGDKSNFGNLVAGKTEQVVAGAWGGYMDAGDWDRRIQHLKAARLLLELAAAFPRQFGDGFLNIPESGDGLPDIVSEALWGMEMYRRMQTPEGGIRGGVESAEHPAEGDCSWDESLDVMAYAPGVWSSHVYAGVAARAAKWLSDHRPDHPNPWHDSAVRAMEWAEAHWPDLDLSEYGHQVVDDRNLAAIEVYCLTRNKRRHDLFMATTKLSDPTADLWQWQSHDQRDAAWVYANADGPLIDAGVRRNCRAAIIREADQRLVRQQKSGFRLAHYEWRPAAWSYFSAPENETLVRAHALTGDVRYLRAAILACQCGLGANPLNLAYTTGLGRRSPQNPLHIDSRRTGQAPPAGLTVFGPMDPVLTKDDWAQKLNAQFVYPGMLQWPAIEAYWDVFLHPAMCEFTIQNPMAVNAYVWGYLAARN